MAAYGAQPVASGAQSNAANMKPAMKDEAETKASMMKPAMMTADDEAEARNGDESKQGMAAFVDDEMKRQSLLSDLLKVSGADDSIESEVQSAILKLGLGTVAREFSKVRAFAVVASVLVAEKSRNLSASMRS